MRKAYAAFVSMTDNDAMDGRTRSMSVLMNEGNRSRIFITPVVMAIINIVLLYGYECAVCALSGDRADTRVAVAMIAFSGLPILLSQVILWGLNRRFSWFDLKEITIVTITNIALFGVLLFLAFPRLAVPYTLIPSGEMAFGFLQFLIQMLAIITVAPCVVGILIYYKYKEERE